jgi:hypothetical protein
MASDAVVLEVVTSVMGPGKPPLMTLVVLELHFSREFGLNAASVDSPEGFSRRNDPGTGVWRCAGLSSGAGGG